MHELADDFLSFAEQKITESHCSHQLPLGIQHITDVDSLTVQPYLTKMLNGLIDRHIFF